MRKILYILILGIGTVFVSLAQINDKLTIPLNIQHAYNTGTRSYDGCPGELYWINRSVYSIKVQINPYTGILTGSELISYVNESSDTLSQLVFRTYWDVFRKGNSRDWQIDPRDVSDGVNIQKLVINGESMVLEGEESIASQKGTNLFLSLDKALIPGNTINIKFDWEEQIPSSQSAQRMGRYDSTSFHIAYWYPQIAVYDDIDGWDTFDFTGIQEFYNDFSDFDVEITVPEHFIVWATGRLQNAEDVLRPEFSKRYFSALNSDEIIHVITSEDLQDGNITKDFKWNTFKYIAKGVPDFAFSISDHYLWDLTSLRVSEEQESRVLIGSAYKQESKEFSKIVELARKSILYFSSEMPEVPFPYQSLTVFNGGGSMEFPMMVNQGNMKLWSVAVFVTSHEISHTYFPFMMGINERKYAWMDEGWATMLNLDFRKDEVPGLDAVEGIIGEYLKVAGSEFDIPLMVPTAIYGSGSQNVYDAYTNSSYFRPGVACYFLEQMVGKESFVEVVQEYIRRWKGKHPQPYDFFFTFNNVLGQDLTWFWKPWFFDFAYPDLSLKLIEKNKDKLTVEILNKGKLPLPVALTVLYEDGKEKEINKSMIIWKQHNKIEISLPLHKKVVKLILGNSNIPDVFTEDNTLYVNRL